MALLSRGINWRKLFDAGDQVRIASALAQLSADLEDLDARMEGGTNDLNQAQQFPAQDLLERGTQFLTPDMVTSTDGSVTVTPDSFRGTVDLAVPVATPASLIFFGGHRTGVGNSGGVVGGFTSTTGSTSGFNSTSGTFTAPTAGTISYAGYVYGEGLSNAAGDRIIVTGKILKNGSSLTDNFMANMSTAKAALETYGAMVSLSGIIDVLSGDTIELSSTVTVSAGSVTASGAASFSGHYLST